MIRDSKREKRRRKDKDFVYINKFLSGWEEIMTEHDERLEIFNALDKYGESHDAEYYCVILTPLKGEKFAIFGSLQQSSAKRGETGLIIEQVVEREVLSPPIGIS